MRRVAITHPVGPIAAKTGTSTSTSASTGASSAASPSTTTATSVTSVFGAPPTITLPTPPAGYSPVVLNDYRGFHPIAGQLAAAPDAAQELRTFTAFGLLFGSAVSSASQYADELEDAVQWTAQRVAAEQFLTYVKSGEAVAWKNALTDLDKLNTVVQLVLAQNPAALASCPALVRLFDAKKAVAKRSHASKARKTKAEKKGTVATPTTTPTTESAAGPAPLAVTATPTATH